MGGNGLKRLSLFIFCIHDYKLNGYNRVMKTAIIALNSKFIHASLAPWYLKAACGKQCGEVRVLEHTVNENINDVLTSIYTYKPDVAAFSCYIWNIGSVVKLASSLKKLLPETSILLGGPEVSYDAKELLNQYPFIDFILAGEGEESFPKLLQTVEKAGLTGKSRSDDFNDIDGLAWRMGDRTVVTPPACVGSLDAIPSPYTDEMLSTIPNRIVYFEASRGCPYSCSYCLSSATAGTRHFALERVFAELDRLMEAGAKQIKFVDRTFNCHRERAQAIIGHILEMDARARRSNGEGIGCNVHFEVGADLFDETLLQMLSDAPEGLFQIEAGVQTVNEKALKAVSRKTDLERLFSNLGRIYASRRVHIHTDLIAGLPFEDYHSFGDSFNKVYGAGADQLQLGFLKFLKGTRMRELAPAHGYLFSDFPPYEVLANTYISYAELIILKGIAELVEKYYNSARFFHSLDYVIKTAFDSPFRFYEDFYFHCLKEGNAGGQTGVREQYVLLDGFVSGFLEGEAYALFRELLRLDFLSSDPSGTLPELFEKRSGQRFVDQCFEYLKSADIAGMLPEAAGMPPKQLFKKIHFDTAHVKRSENETGNGSAWNYDVIGQVYLFNHMKKDKVTGRYPFYAIALNSKRTNNSK
jgi:radical SAM superfamily enzyme YgiQ (UPF0313 family)